MRPWLQDFKLGAAYDKKMVQDQIQAARDAGVSGFAMWNARNVYTESAYLEKLPEPNPNPPLKVALLEEIRKRDMAKAGLENRSTAIRKSGPVISKPVRK
jgi:hypothetical protein